MAFAPFRRLLFFCFWGFFSWLFLEVWYIVFSQYFLNLSSKEFVMKFFSGVLILCGFLWYILLERRNPAVSGPAVQPGEQESGGIKTWKKRKFWTKKRQRKYPAAAIMRKARGCFLRKRYRNWWNRPSGWIQHPGTNCQRNFWHGFPAAWVGRMKRKMVNALIAEARRIFIITTANGCASAKCVTVLFGVGTSGFTRMISIDHTRH